MCLMMDVPTNITDVSFLTGYWVSDTEMTWYDANRACKSRGMHLLSIGSRSEYKAVGELLGIWTTRYI